VDEVSDMRAKRRGARLRLRLSLFALAVAAALAAYAPLARAAGFICPRCHVAGEEGWRFCPYDGARLVLDGAPKPGGAPAGATPTAVVAPTPETAPAPASSDAPASSARASDSTSAFGAAPAPAPSSEVPGAPEAPSAADAPTASARPDGLTPRGRREIAQRRLEGARDALEAARSNPMDTVDDLFRAIAAGDARWMRRLYRWDVFLAGVAPAELDAREAAYCDRLIARVKPTLAGRDRFPAHVALTADTADLTIQLRDRETRETIESYEFKLTKGEDGWKITLIRP
jgi:hypothetical protein